MDYDFTTGFWRKRAVKGRWIATKTAPSRGAACVSQVPRRLFRDAEAAVPLRPQVLVSLAANLVGALVLFVLRRGRRMEAIVSVDIADLEKPKISM